MRMKNSGILLIMIGLGLMTPFTNCSDITQGGFEASSLDTCTGGQCSTSNRLELGWAPNFSQRVTLISGQTAADIGGDCNEGGFPDNSVTWQIVRGSSVEKTCAQASACTRCYKGRYQASVDFNGVQMGNDLQIVVEIKGYTGTGAEVTNPFNARKTLPVQAL